MRFNFRIENHAKASRVHLKPWQCQPSGHTPRVARSYVEYTKPQARLGNTTPWYTNVVTCARVCVFGFSFRISFVVAMKNPSRHAKLESWAFHQDGKDGKE